MGNKIVTVVVKRNPSEPPVLSTIDDALLGVGVRVHRPEYSSAGDFLFSIEANKIPQARKVFDKLRSEGRIHDYEVKEK